MRRTTMALGAMATVAALAVVAERDAAACGGCFHPPTPPGENESVITDHRMVLSVSPQQTTLYDQIRYQGSPSSFAWVLPINGSATIGLSSDTLFSALDQVTGTTVEAPPTNCPAPPSSCGSFNGAGGASDGTATPSAAADAGTVTVTHEETVGPYETVQLHSTDANALSDWLSSHGYVVPADVQPIIAAYVNEHFDFLALKLVPGAGVQSMRPVRVTTAGAAPVLPLRMVAAGTGATVGVTLWVIGDGRYDTQNFPSFHVSDSDLIWDWATSASNYRDLRAQNEAALGGRGWEVESSTTQSQQSIRQYVLNLGQFGGPDSGTDYLPVDPNDAGSSGETSDQVRQDDLDALFMGIGLNDQQARITRLRTDLAHAALADDLVLTAAADQSVASNIRQVTRESGEPQCPVYNPSTCAQIGTAPRSQLTSSGSSSFACSLSPDTTSNTLTWIGLAGLAGAIVTGAKRRRRG